MLLLTLEGKQAVQVGTQPLAGSTEAAERTFTTHRPLEAFVAVALCGCCGFIVATHPMAAADGGALGAASVTHGGTPEHTQQLNLIVTIITLNDYLSVKDVAALAGVALHCDGKATLYRIPGPVCAKVVSTPSVVQHSPTCFEATVCETVAQEDVQVTQQRLQCQWHRLEGAAVHMPNVALAATNAAAMVKATHQVVCNSNLDRLADSIGRWY